LMMNRMPDQCAGPSAGCSEVRDWQASGVCGRKSLRRRRPADVSCANKQYVQTRLLVSNTATASDDP
jgi:hypothetical protein